MIKDLAFLAGERQHVAHLRRFLGRLEALRLNFILMSIWSGVGRPGAWPDADMLPLGRIGIRAERGDERMTHFTPDEQRTLMSLWSIAQSPLMFGGDLPSNDEFTLSLITNDEVLAVDQKGAAWRCVCRRRRQRGLDRGRRGSPDAKYVAVFNVGDRGPLGIRVDWPALGLPAKCALRDLWERKDVGAIEGGYTFQVQPHGSGLYKVGEKSRGQKVKGPGWVSGAYALRGLAAGGDSPPGMLSVLTSI